VEQKPMAIHDDDRTEAQRLKDLPPDSQFRQEAERLAKLSARERMEALAVHWRIADDGRLSRATRDYARNVAETLELLTALNLPSIKEEVRSGSLPGFARLARKRAGHGWT
jgi:hypothetical protein